MVDEVLKVKTELCEKQKSEIRDLKKQLDFLKAEGVRMKETIVKLSIDSSELQIMKKKN